MYDVIIIGSGASGVASALEFSSHNIKPLMLDVGYEASETIENDENLYKLKEKEQTSSFLIGKDFDYFKKEKQKLPSKLKSPYLDFVTKKPDSFSIKQNNYNVITSYAKGGLANAWGNGLMRFSKDEFDELPISLDDLIPYYEKLELEIGISGRNDDLVEFFGKCDPLQNPLDRSKKTKILYDRYLSRKDKLNKKGTFLGTPRIGVSNNDYDVRDKCKYDNLEFWQPNHKSLYSPSMTLDKLIAEDKLEYKNSIFVDRWEKVNGIIEVVGYHIDTKKEFRFKTKKLVLAAGTLNTSRIVLKSRKDYKTKLTFFDNPAIQLPIFFPTLIGDTLDIDSFGLIQLNLFYKSEILKKNAIGAVLEITSPMRNEFLDKFPFGIKDNIKFIKYVLPCMMACQVFLPSSKELSAKLSLEENGDIIINSKEDDIPQNLIDEATKKLQELGMMTFSNFAIKVSHGNGIHYGGTLPMSKNPTSAYQTTIDGELSQDKDIFIVDGSCFGYIPATNYSLSVMANAMRISKKISAEI
jgi:choline dehydrogenase-like flavoprotein